MKGIIICLNGNNSFSASISDKKKNRIVGYEVAVMSENPEECVRSSMQDSDRRFIIQLDSHKTKAVAWFDDKCIATSKSVPKKMKHLGNRNIFCAIYWYDDGCVHGIWIEGMGKGYRHFFMETAGFEKDETKEIFRGFIPLLSRTLGIGANVQENMKMIPRVNTEADSADEQVIGIGRSDAE